MITGFDSPLAKSLMGLFIISVPLSYAHSFIVSFSVSSKCVCGDEMRQIFLCSRKKVGESVRLVPALVHMAAIWPNCRDFHCFLGV